MNTRALTLALRLLTTACAGAALGTMTGCPGFFGCGEDDGWQTEEALELGTTADLEALAELGDSVGEKYWRGLAVGAGGAVVTWGGTYSGPDSLDWTPFAEQFTVGSGDLHAAVAADSGWWVVGDGGMAALSDDRGETWTPADLAGTSANLYGVATHESSLVVVGDGVVFVRAADGTWTEASAPADGWGELRGVYSVASRVYAVGLGGVVWSASDPGAEWVAEDIGVDVDLFDVDHIYDTATGEDDIVLIVGAQGTIVRGDPSGGWTRVDVDTSADIVDCASSGVLSADGEVFDVESGDTASLVTTVAGARSLSYSAQSSLVTVGGGGSATTTDFYYCVGGRPFVVGGELRTASLCSREDWCGALAEEGPAPAELAEDLAADLAAAWAQDGLYEHASVASFARFGLELLALGAPPRLLRAVSVGIADELRHAELCFALARRFGATPVGPGAMTIPADALARVGDPVATALALFEEGCVNESVAACEAADAAGECEDAGVRQVLETLAADERHHASAAWAGLRWLLGRYGERVAGPLRARVARRHASVEASSQATRAMGQGSDHFDPRLAAFGRLSPQRRAEVQRRVLATLVLPLARTMLGRDQAATRAELA